MTSNYESNRQNRDFKSLRKNMCSDQFFLLVVGGDVRPCIYSAGSPGFDAGLLSFLGSLDLVTQQEMGSKRNGKKW